jgi:hypothetical protein
MKRDILLGIGVGSLLTLLASYGIKAIGYQQVKKDMSKLLFVGIELGGTNYTVAFG